MWSAWRCWSPPDSDEAAQRPLATVWGCPRGNTPPSSPPTTPSRSAPASASSSPADSRNASRVTPAPSSTASVRRAGSWSATTPAAPVPGDSSSSGSSASPRTDRSAGSSRAPGRVSGVDDTVPPGWPVEVRPPGAPDWERTAVAWLFDLVPPDYRAHEVLRRYPVLLARFAADHVSAGVGGARPRGGGPGGRPRRLADRPREARRPAATRGHRGRHERLRAGGHPTGRGGPRRRGG